MRLNVAVPLAVVCTAGTSRAPVSAATYVSLPAKSALSLPHATVARMVATSSAERSDGARKPEFSRAIGEPSLVLLLDDLPANLATWESRGMDVRICSAIVEQCSERIARDGCCAVHDGQRQVD